MIELSRITIIRSLDEDGEDVISIEAVMPDGEPLALVEALGLLEFAKADRISELVMSTPPDDSTR